MNATYLSTGNGRLREFRSTISVPRESKQNSRIPTFQAQAAMPLLDRLITNSNFGQFLASSFKYY